MNRPATLRLWVHRAVCGFVWLVATIAGWLGTCCRRERFNRPSICIESGRKGWDLIEYQEIGQSATEFFGVDSVVKHSVIDRKRYVSECLSIVRSTRPKLYWVDPRSGSQEPFRAVFQSFALAVIFAWYGVTPLAWLADGPNRVWRLQAEVLTAKSGTCLVFMHPRKGGVRFAHCRVHGPCIFPLSIMTLRRLQIERSRKQDDADLVVSFVGSLYEPRRSRLLALGESLAQQGVRLRLIAPELTGRRLTNAEYWDALVQSDILVTTADHVESNGHDVVLEPHFVFRFTEALAAGTALVAPVVRGSEALVRPGLDYAPYGSLTEAAALIVELCISSRRRSFVSEHGHDTISHLVEGGWFWKSAIRAASSVRGQQEC